jgi:beta-xylosidase
MNKNSFLFIGLSLACLSGNPIFPGWYADPETAVYDNTYWVYPTYSAPYKDQVFFDAFSSPDLVHWYKHPHIVDTTAIRWAKKAMWAPAIAKKDGKYYFFFGANDIQNDSSTGGIGIAVADRPEGPYRDYLGHPLVDKFYNGAQPIDQAVFQDHDGSWYLIYGGWRHCNIARLKADFTGFLPFPDGEVFKEITPDKYVEGPYMIERNGKYYFMWSEGGWGGPEYSVAYAMADKPTGPFKRIGKILQQDMAVATGAGHHSVLHIPGTDDYYIVYHRRPLGETDANHRVVCIDKMEFTPDGLIRPVKITREGVPPRLTTFAQKTEKFYDYEWKATDGPHARFYSIVERTDSGWFDNGNPSYAGRLAPDYKSYGKWQYFHKNGQTSAFELYNNGSLVDRQYFDEAGQPVLDTTNKDRSPAFLLSKK